MEGKKCPYCGRRISYFTTFHEKKQGLHSCPRCNKECKIKTDLRLIFGFAAVALIVIMFMIIWLNSGNYNNPLGIVVVAAILLAFYFSTPLFVRFVPLKKYTRSNDDSGYREDNGEQDDFSYTFNRDVFDEVKKNRRTQSAKPAEKTVVREVPIIKNVSEAQASSSDAPLKRVVSQPEYEEEPEVEYREEVKTYVPKKKPDGSKYTANRML